MRNGAIYWSPYEAKAVTEITHSSFKPEVTTINNKQIQVRNEDRCIKRELPQNKQIGIKIYLAAVRIYP